MNSAHASESRVSNPASAEVSDLQETIRLRAEEIYIRNGRIPGHDTENWIQAETEIMSEQKRTARKPVVVIRVNGRQYVGEYGPDSADGYTPGEFVKGDPVPVRFDGDCMYLKRPNGKELATTIVRPVV